MKEIKARNLAKLRTLKAAAAITDPGYGEWVYDTWLEHNERFFGGDLEVGGISWGLTPHGGSLGHYALGSRDIITLHISLLYPKSDAWGAGELLGPNFAADVLLHEMVHQAIWQRNGHNGEGISSHNNECWVAEINRIAPLLGLKPNAKVVKQRRVEGKVRWVPEDGYMTRRQLSGWPHSARPPSYYEETAVRTLGKKARYWEK